MDSLSGLNQLILNISRWNLLWKFLENLLILRLPVINLLLGEFSFILRLLDDLLRFLSLTFFIYLNHLLVEFSDLTLDVYNFMLGERQLGSQLSNLGLVILIFFDEFNYLILSSSRSNNLLKSFLIVDSRYLYLFNLVR